VTLDVSQNQPYYKHYFMWYADVKYLGRVEQEHSLAFERGTRGCTRHGMTYRSVCKIRGYVVAITVRDIDLHE
jgi:hypothetical protein